MVVPRLPILNRMTTQLRQLSEAKNVHVDRVEADTILHRPKGKAIRLILASNLPILLRNAQCRKAVQQGLRLVVCENLELLDPPYELGVSTLLHLTQSRPTRYLGLSSSLDDPTDLAAWLNVDPFALHSFRPQDREQPLSVSTQSFTIPQSAAYFKAMAKPAHDAIQDMVGEQAIIFVPSNGLCSSVALDLLTQRALSGSETFVPDVDINQKDVYMVRAQNPELRDFISRGVGFFHGALSKSDRTLVLEMYERRDIRVLIVPRTSLWSLPVRAGVVIVMGTQFFHITHGGEQRQLRDYGWEELVHMQGRAVRHDAMGRFHLFCQAEGKDTILRFLNGGLPLESKLLESGALEDWYKELKARELVRNEQDALDALSYTFLARRLESNPNYYDVLPDAKDENVSRIVDRLYKSAST